MVDPYFNVCNGVLCYHADIPPDYTPYILIALVIIIIVFFYGGYRLVKKLMFEGSSSERYK